MQPSNITGVIPAVPTPFSLDGKLDAAAFLEHGQWCLDHGASALNILGTTGEANSLSVSLRREIMTVAAENLDRSRLMVGTATPDLATTIDLTQRAESLGYAAALVLPPFYYKPVSEDGLFAWFDRLIAATGTIDRYLYNFPQLTGIVFGPDFATRLKAAHPERIRGAKDSSGDLDYARNLAAIRDFDVFPSSETALAEAATSGFAGCISASVNVNPALADRLWRDQANDTLAQKVRALRAGVAAFPLIGAVKHLVGRRTGNAIWSHVMPPNLPITDETARETLASVVLQSERITA